ncbi:MAG: DUF6036 family nucleotidyltransferase [Actinomycetes bacterium]
MEMDRDFNEFAELLLDHEVRFLIVGGYALAAHGAPRYTGDLDAWLWVDPINATRVLAVLEECGFEAVDVTIEALLNPDLVIQLGYPPHRIDLLTGIDGVSFDAAWDRRVEFDIAERRIPFISRDDLIANKVAAGRPQDIADVARLTGHDGSPEP